MPGSDSALAIRLSDLAERFRQSLFFLPALWVIALLGLSRVTLEIDQRLEPEEVPEILSTTVESGQALLGAIASGTITAASVVFSLTLLSVQLASSQFSPRTLRNFLGDRFQQNVFGVVLGTFAFSIVVLRDIRGPLTEEGSPVIPYIGIALSTLLALASLFALLGSINRTARGLRVNSVADQIVEETLETIRHRFPGRAEIVGMSQPDRLPAPGIGSNLLLELPDGLSESDAAVITASRLGWIQQIGVDALAEALPEGSLTRLDVTVGSYVVEGMVLATVHPAPEVDGDLIHDVRDAFVIGEERTLQQDVAYGLLQLEDIALRALSPGINDPNTATGVISQMGAVLLELFAADLDDGVIEHEGRRIERPNEFDHTDYLRGAIDKIRRAGRDEPAILLTLLRMLALVRGELVRRRVDRPETLTAIDQCAGLVLAEAELCDAQVVDRRSVTDLYERLDFGPTQNG